MFCPNCGNPVEENANFCCKCGADMAVPNATPADEAPQTPADTAPDYQALVYPPEQPIEKNKVGKIFSLVSLLCGIISLVLCWIPFVMEIPAIAAVVLGILGIKKNGSKGKCITGIILGAIAFVLILIVSLAVGLSSFYYYGV